MPDFLDINGVSVSVANDAAAMPAPIDIGDEERALDGSKIRTRIALKQQYSWTTAPIDAATAAALKAMIQGYGHHWSFDLSIYSSKGLAPFGTNISQASGGKYSGRLKVGAGNGVYSTCEFQPSGLDDISVNGTAMFWGRAQDGSTWNHYLQTWAAGAITGSYKNGVSFIGDGMLGLSTSAAYYNTHNEDFEVDSYGAAQNGGVTIPAWIGSHTYTTNFLVRPTTPNGRYYFAKLGGMTSGSEPTWPVTLNGTVTDGAVIWQDAGPIDTYADDLVLFPFAVPSSWVSQLYTFHAAQAFPDIPRVYASGNYLLNAGLMFGKVGQTKLMQSYQGGVLTQNLQTVEFNLEEA